jgi:hypothetical protein
VTVRYEIGDTRQVVATLPDASVALVASSPPFIALRSYLPADHEHKHAEIGSEPDPATFLDTLLELTAEWGRVLAPWGSIAIELGDTYAGSGGGGGDYLPGGLREHQPGFGGSADRARDGNAAHWRAKQVARHAWPRAKSLALIPQLYATSLAYGRNLLTGEPSPAGQWLVRNVIVWHRPNPAVGALGDKVRPSTSYITVATRSPKRWFDLDAVRTASRKGYTEIANGGRYAASAEKGANTSRGDLGAGDFGCDPAGAPPLDCWFDEHDTWTITTQPSSLAHYAMWPARLAERLILMMCPAQVCAACGAPRRRLTADNPQLAAAKVAVGDKWQSGGLEKGMKRPVGADRIDVPGYKLTLGWSDCGHDDYVPGVVLDPFAGTGTTLAVADLHGRDAIGIDIDERNAALYPRRRDECARALFDVRPQMTGQLGLFGEAL